MDGEFNCCIWQGGKALLNQRVCRLETNDGIFIGSSFDSYEKAIKYHNKSFSIYREFNDEFGQASACVNMASTYRKKKDYQNAILSCEKAMVHAQ